MREPFIELIAMTSEHGTCQTLAVGERLPLERGRRYRIGRVGTADIVCHTPGQGGRVNAILIVDELGQCELRHAGHSNPYFYRGESVTHDGPLVDGDEFGPAPELVFRLGYREAGPFLRARSWARFFLFNPLSTTQPEIWRAIENKPLSPEPRVMVTLLAGDYFELQQYRDLIRAGRVEHPAVPTLLEHGRDSYGWFVVHEEAVGMSLASVLAAGGRLDVKLIGEVMQEVASAIAAVPDDVELRIAPEGIVIDWEGRVWLRSVGPLPFFKGPGNTVDDSYLAWLPPERVIWEQPAGYWVPGAEGRRAQVFSLGLLLGALLTCGTDTGRLIGAALSGTSVQRDARELVIGALDELGDEDEVDFSWRGVVRACLHFAPGDRIAGPNALQAALDRMLAAEGRAPVGALGETMRALFAEQWAEELRVREELELLDAESMREWVDHHGGHR